MAERHTDLLVVFALSQSLDCVSPPVIVNLAKRRTAASEVRIHPFHCQRLRGSPTGCGCSVLSTTRARPSDGLVSTGIPFAFPLQLLSLQGSPTPCSGLSSLPLLLVPRILFAPCPSDSPPVGNLGLCCLLADAFWRRRLQKLTAFELRFYT